MQPFTRITGIAVPMLEDDINTDQIAPVQMSRALKPNYADLLFKRARVREDGSENSDFVLNRPQYRKAAILVTGRNFGCGSSREAAVWCLQAFGISAIITRSIADIYRENCLQNGVLAIELPDQASDALEKRVLAADGSQPFTIDLTNLTIGGPGGPDIGFEIGEADRMRLLEGLDDIGFTLKYDADIAAWEKRMAVEMPWLQTARDGRKR